VLAQVVAITSLSVVVSLPHQMLGHIPIDKVSKGLNDAMDELIEKDDDSNSETSSNDNKDTDEDDEVEGEAMKEEIPTLQEIFHPGQYVRAVVMAVHPHGVVAPPSTSGMSLGKPRNELEKASRRVELSLLPQDVNSGITVKDLGKGFVSLTILAYHLRLP
jgi:rRNA biogenesis protein RRP5